MTQRELLIQELNGIPENSLGEVLHFVNQLKSPEEQLEQPYQDISPYSFASGSHLEQILEKHSSII